MENVGLAGLAAFEAAGFVAAGALAAVELAGFDAAAADGEVGAGEVLGAVCAAPQPASSTAVPTALLRRNCRREYFMTICSPPGGTSIPEEGLQDTPARVWTLLEKYERMSTWHES